MSKYSNKRFIKELKAQSVKEKVKTRKLKSHLLLLGVLVLLLVPVTVFYTLAYQTDTTGKLVNEFEPKEVIIDIVEEFDHTVKEDVSIINTGEVDAYIRFKMAISVIDEDGNTVALPITVIKDADKTYRGIDINDFTMIEDNWTSEFIENDGIYYYKSLVSVGKSVPLFTKAVFNVDMLSTDILLPIVDAQGNPYYIFEEGKLKSQMDDTGKLIAYDKDKLLEGQTSLRNPFTYMTKEYTPVLVIMAESIQANGVEEVWPVTIGADKKLIINTLSNTDGVQLYTVSDVDVNVTEIELEEY